MTIDIAQRLGEAERQQREENGEHARADAAHEVELQEVARAPHALELGAEHPERQHVEEQVEEAAVQEHVRRRLPDAQLRDDICVGMSPSQVSARGRPGSIDCAMNTTTFAAISAFIAVEIGPGPKENDTACGEG